MGEGNLFKPGENVSDTSSLIAAEQESQDKNMHASFRQASVPPLCSPRDKISAPRPRRVEFFPVQLYRAAFLARKRASDAAKPCNLAKTVPSDAASYSYIKIKTYVILKKMRQTTRETGRAASYAFGEGDSAVARAKRVHEMPPASRRLTLDDFRARLPCGGARLSIA